MPRSLRIIIIAIAAPLTLWAWLGALFALDRVANAGEVLGRVTVTDTHLGGLTEGEARATIAQLHQRRANEPITVIVEGTEFTLAPREVGFWLDEEALLDQAMRAGRDGNVLGQMQRWLSTTIGGGTRALDGSGTYNRDSLLAILRLWERLAIADPPTEGGIVVLAGVVSPVYPTAGNGIDLEATADLIEAEIFGARNPVTALTEYRVPMLTDADVDVAVGRAERLVAGPVTLSKIVPEASITFPRSVLLDAIASRVIGTDEDPQIDVFFQVGPLVQFLGPIRESIETPARDAQVVIDPFDSPLILPGAPAALVDDAALPRAVFNAASSVTRTAPLPMRDGAPPQFTTEDAEGLGIKELLYTATTFYTSGGTESNRNRVINIQTMADEVNGVIVMPGEVFSLNEHIGQRTLEKGYRRAGAIIGPIIYCCDHPANIGGGVSQFATTLYNAVFWSGLEDVDHTPHTLYISRYPMVREATLGFPSPDLKFRNDTENAIYIKTEHTSTSVTVKFFGDNGGLIIESILGERQNFTEPEIYYEPDASLPPDVEEETDEGEPGFTVSITRIIRYPDGTTREQTWWHTYHPWPIVVAVHPCKLPEDHLEYDASIQCPVQVPADLVGKRYEQAQSALNNIGLRIFRGPDIVVEDESQDGLVLEVFPGPGTWLDPGSDVTVRVGRYDG
ncbi:MAG TPA: VanW family protein [Acidimicrobiia bacterium]|nr:VanW family protein [Acidimicrobiia bacterium]